MKVSSTLIAVFVVLFFFYHSNAEQLIQNGTFEQPYSEGWTIHDSVPVNRISQSVDLHPDADIELVLKGFHSSKNFYTLSQIVELKDNDLKKYFFSIDMSFIKRSGDGYAAAGLAVRFIDELDSVLGSRIIYTLTDTIYNACIVSDSDCIYELWPDSQHTTYLEIEDTITWEAYSFTLEQAFNEAVSSGSDKVTQVEVVIWAASGWYG